MTDPGPAGAGSAPSSEGGLPPGTWRGRAAHVGGTLRAAAAALPAWPLLAGVALGFGLCCLAGRSVSQRPMFENFVRFHGPISPASLFYPTATELVTYVELTVPRDKYLVVVGGASYFRGTGQNPDELWTRELQRLLGDDYAVVNFAADQAGVTSFAAVAFRVLAREYPRIAYVANASPVVVDPVDGSEVYRFAFWDAYYKGLLSLPSPWADGVREIAKSERKDRAGLELHLGKWTDRLSYACDLWTYVGYRYFFTVWSDFTAGSTTAPRRDYVDPTIPNLAEVQQNRRHNPAYVQHSEEMNRDFSTKGFQKDADGKLIPAPYAFDIISQLSAAMFPDDQKPKCYLVFVRANPFYMKTFRADDWARHETMYRLGEEAFARTGYRVVDLPDASFAEDDYYDAGHYMASGGRKLAKAVADSIRKAPAKPTVTP